MTIPLRSDDERRAYARGYHAGKYRTWPDHKPPEPPNEVVAQLMRALKELRDSADGICAALDEQDEFVVELGPRIDAADEALKAVTEWLNAGEVTGRS